MADNSQHRTNTSILYCSAVYFDLMLFIEASHFTRLLPEYLSDDDYRLLQNFLMQKPDMGKIVRGAGGVRKIRWAASGNGKRGVLRVIYYWKRSDHEIWMLTIYRKSETATIPANLLRKIAEAIAHD